MALDDRRHVEAVAIIRRLLERRDADALRAADLWLKENHPAPSVYVNAVSEPERKEEP